MADPARVCLYFRLEDRFGDNGLISTVILDLPPDGAGALTIDTWAMSCRVLSRGMEQFILSEIRSYAARTGARIVGRYIPTAKNALVAGLYQRLGFRKLDEVNSATLWELSPDEAVDLGHHIKRVPASGQNEGK
jgi:FkbH-like protein